MGPKGYWGTFARIVPWAAIWLSVFLAPLCYFGLVVAQDFVVWKAAIIVIVGAVLFGMMVAVPISYLAMARTVDIPCVDRRFVKWIVDWKTHAEKYDTLTVMKDGLVYDKSKNPTLLSDELVVKFRDDVASITGPRIVVDSLVRTFRAYHR